MPRLQLYLLVAALAGCGGDEPCDPVAQTGCDEGQVCENVSGGDPACFAPVAIEGRVFDLSSQAGIEGARVVAVDVNGAAVSNVVESGTDGAYSLPIPMERNEDGTPVDLSGNVTLRSEAATYEAFPGAIRQPLPIDLSTGVAMDGKYTIQGTLTDIAMSKLADGGAVGRIEGKVELPEGITGAVIVAEGADGKGYPTIAALDGDYAILNVPNGDYTMQAYLVDHNYTAGTATVNANTVKVDLSLSPDDASSITGSVIFADPGAGTMTSVILFIESTYDANTGRGVTVPGLRSPRDGAPNILAGTPFTMEGVPAGKYVAAAAFENDGLVRDPDTCQGNNADVHIIVEPATPLTIAQEFKITGALDVIDPGASGVQPISGTPTFSWVDDASEDTYVVDLFDSYGDQVWTKTIPGVSGGTPTLVYDGPALQPGMYYQFRVTSSRLTNQSTRCNISRTEDLKGVFFMQ